MSLMTSYACHFLKLYPSFPYCKFQRIRAFVGVFSRVFVGILCWVGTSVKEQLKVNKHDAISCCTQPLSNSLICKLSLWFQHNSTKKSYKSYSVYWP